MLFGIKATLVVSRTPDDDVVDFFSDTDLDTDSDIIS